MSRYLTASLASLGLLAGMVSASPTAAGAAGNAWVAVAAPDQTLRAGCRDYEFTYRVRTPGDAWMLELSLVGPDGERLASNTYYSDVQPAAGRTSWQLCDVTTRPGVHRIRIKATAYDGRDQSTRVEPAVRFRLKPKK